MLVNVLLANEREHIMLRRPGCLRSKVVKLGDHLAEDYADFEGSTFVAVSRERKKATASGTKEYVG
jgi:hypothetical protein